MNQNIAMNDCDTLELTEGASLTPQETDSHAEERRNGQGPRQIPSKSAGLTLHELETYFAIEIVEGYHQRVHSALQRPPIARPRSTMLLKVAPGKTCTSFIIVPISRSMWPP
jgi:hypothetical protein